MTIAVLAEEIGKLLHFDKYSTDISLNGLQVCADYNRNVKKAAFAVDACQETIELSVSLGADILFVHHGLFWGHPIAVTGTHYKRLKTMMDGSLSLFASHIPLDAHPELGNNAQIAKYLELEQIEPFAEWREMSIGFKGVLKRPLSNAEIIKKLEIPENPHNAIINAGPDFNKTVAIVSGGAPDDVSEAIIQGIDCFITGDSSHTEYHTAKEGHINMLSLGHYATETFGIKALCKYVATEYDIKTEFIDVPTLL